MMKKRRHFISSLLVGLIFSVSTISSFASLKCLPQDLPNVFSPNGDGINDIFRLGITSVSGTYEFKIFNRWGQLVFSSSKPNQGWDGRYQGVMMDEGVYYYYAIAGIDTGETIEYSGTLTLLR